ncbi:MAG: GGDEF domain-containing phosphodiesterase [Gammaproteobacteria bacterium]|nr:GGDEF domain-containing phosphodiesterase [Gammaproteobacteria bacterium]
MTDDLATLVNMLTTVTPTPDVVVSDDSRAFSHLAFSSAALVFLGSEAAGAAIATINPDNDDTVLYQQLKTCVNLRRFQSRFAEPERTEPITSLPRHEELFKSLQRYNGMPMGLMIIHIDHAEHLYASLDPVSKTDLLSALGAHIRHVLPHVGELGFYNASCFIFALPGTSEQVLGEVSQQLLSDAQLPVMYRGGEIFITVSIGFSFEARFADSGRIWADAWQAMGRAAEQGGNRAEGPIDTNLSERIPEALGRDEFSLVLQSQWSLKDTKLRGAEALLRWQGMEVGELAPNHFIPIAEQHGHMARIGDWVLERACREASTWFERLIDPLWLCINVSPQQFHNNAISNQIDRIRRERWLEPTMLELELSHENMLHLVDDYRDQLYGLRDLGVRFALDNLGHSLIDTPKLLRCPVDTLKIDRSLIADIETDPQAADLVQQICRLSNRYKLRVVAVGVENEAQLELLGDFGCNDVQGYLLSQPIALHDFRQLLVRPAFSNPAFPVRKSTEQGTS